MRKLSTSLCLVLLGLTAGCVRASFSPAEGQDASHFDTASGGGDEPATICSLTPLGGCSPQRASGAICDPVCQEGTCPCGQKCSIAGDGTTGCSSAGTHAPGASCAISYADQASQSDECAPGNICLPVIGELASYCYKHCRTNQDCDGGTACSKRVLSDRNNVKVSVCDPLYSKCDDLVPDACCNPVTPTGPTACQSGFCYLVPPVAVGADSRTVCEYGMGDGRKGASCVWSRDCWEGWSCAPSGFCQQVCDVKDTSGSQCPNGGACTPFGKQYGFCPSQ